MISCRISRSEFPQFGSLYRADGFGGMPFQVAPKPSRLDLVGFDIPEDINRW